MRYIKAKKVSYGGVVFDSQFEFNVFNALRSAFSATAIEVHTPLTVRPRTRWFKSQEWKVDFRVALKDSVNSSSQLYVEAKGIIQDDFKEKLKNLSYFRPDVFENLVIVSPTARKILIGINSVTIKDFTDFLLHKEFEGLVNHCKKEL